MRYCFFILLIAIGCNNKVAIPTPSHPMMWMEGGWIRDNNQEGVITYEDWTLQDIHTMRGHGYTLAGQDTTFNEHMLLRKVGSHYRLSIATSGNVDTVHFKVNMYHETGFVASNPDHDFPQHIKYVNLGDKMKAVVYNEEHRIDFLFSKHDKASGL